MGTKKAIFAFSTPALSSPITLVSLLCGHTCEDGNPGQIVNTDNSTVGSPNTADLGIDEKAAVFGNRRYWESYIT